MVFSSDHWEDKWHSYRPVGTRLTGEDKAELGGVVWIDIHTVESVSEVCLVDHYGSLGGVGEKDQAEDMIEGVTKLHCFHGVQWDGVMVDSRPGVVADPLQAAISLGYHDGWVEANPF